MRHDLEDWQNGWEMALEAFRAAACLDAFVTLAVVAVCRFRAAWTHLFSQPTVAVDRCTETLLSRDRTERWFMHWQIPMLVIAEIANPLATLERY